MQIRTFLAIAGIVVITGATPAFAGFEKSAMPDATQNSASGVDRAPGIEAPSDTINPQAPSATAPDSDIGNASPGLQQNPNQMVGQVVSVDPDRGVVVVKTEVGVIPVHASVEDIRQLQPGDLVMLVMPDQPSVPSASPAEPE